MTGVEAWWLIGGIAGVVSLMMVAAVSVRKRRSAAEEPLTETIDTPAFAPANTASTDEKIPLFEQAPIGLCQFDVKGRILRCNALLLSRLGLSADALSDMPFAALVHAEDLDRCRLDQRELLARSAAFCSSEIRVRDAHGQLLWTRLGLALVRNERGQAHYFIASFSDIDKKKKADALLQLQEEKLQAIVGHIPVAIWLSAANDARIVFVNDAFETVWGFSRELFYIDPESARCRIHSDDRESVCQAVAGAGTQGGYDVNYRIQRDDGDVRYVREMSRGIFDSHGRLLYRVNSVTDISSELQVRKELSETNHQLQEANLRWRESARLDNLTGCLNRTAFFEEVDKALQLEQRYGRSSTLVFFDLNNFKDVNDNFGHHVGDRALIAFVAQIKTRLRTTDELGRYGGDEFVALLRETDALQARLLLATLAPIVVDAENGNSVILRFSAGVTCSDDSAIETVDDWTRIADSQMYYQRMRRKGR